MTRTRISSRRRAAHSVAIVLGVVALAGAQPPAVPGGALSDHQNTFTVGVVWWFGNKQGAW